jgi:hypothetical protein
MSNKVKVIVAAVCLVAAIGLLGWYMSRGSKPSPSQLEVPDAPTDVPAN